MPLTVAHYKQERSTSCLAAACRSVLAYFGLERSEAEIRQQIHTKATGTHPINVYRLREWGVEVKVEDATITDVQELIRKGSPPIAFVNIAALPHHSEESEYSHTVIVVDLDDHSASIMDPAHDASPVQVPLGVFLQAWSFTGNLLAVIERAAPSETS